MLKAESIKQKARGKEKARGMQKAKSRKLKAWEKLKAESLKLKANRKICPVFLLKAFTFLLLPLAFTLSSCRFNPNLQGKGEVYLQGSWQQDSSVIQQQLLVASQYHIRFDCDSFFVQINYHSKVNYGSDTCRNTGHWAEYIKGAYSQKNDTLLLKGQYCNGNFTLKTNTDCFGTGPYQEFFKVSKKADTLIQLSGTSMLVPVNLKMIKKTICTQKSL